MAFQLDVTSTITTVAVTMAALALTALCILLLINLPQILRIKQDRIHTIQLDNQGNVRSIYQLSVFSPYKDLQFQFLMNGIPLVIIAEEEPASVQDTLSSHDLPPEAHENVPPNPPQRSGSVTASGAEVIQKAGKSSRTAASISGSIANVLGVIGSFLPGSLGRSIKTQAANARKVQTDVTRASQVPDQTMRKVDVLKKESSRLNSQKSDHPTQASINPKPASIQEQNADQRAPTRQQKKSPRPIKLAVPQRVQTIELGPGESLGLTLRIHWKKLFLPAVSLPYTLQSQQVPVGMTFIDAPTPVSHSGVVFFKPVAAWRYWLFFLFSTLFLLLLLGALVLTVRAVLL